MRSALIRPTDVEPRAEHCLWIRYSDGTAGEVDLSHLAGRGVPKLGPITRINRWDLGP